MKNLGRAAPILFMLLFGGCGGDALEGGAHEKKELLLYCGAGIRPPVEELVEIFEREHGVHMAVDYAGSEVLLSKIKLSRKGDLYMPGDRHYIDQAAEAGMIHSRNPVCYFIPAILVRKGNPKGIKGLRDLLAPGIRLGLGDAKACAIGRKTEKIFEKNDIPWERVEANLAYQSLTVNELGMQIQAGSLDAVIVWDAIARYYTRYGEVVPIPVEQNITSTVELGVLDFSRAKKQADSFMAFAMSDRGRSIFAKHNYTVDPPSEANKR
jgi:molybdate transport system substrate-binding protein